VTRPYPDLVTDKTVHNYENNQQDAQYRLIYYSKSALHVSGDVFAHQQEHLTVFTVSGNQIRIPNQMQQSIAKFIA
jgi:hypothetical protein